MSSDGTRIGSLKQVVELRARIVELESELRISDEKLDDQTGLLLGERESRKKAEAELAAERERREAAEEILHAIRKRYGADWDTLAIDAHFARYEKEPT